MTPEEWEKNLYERQVANKRAARKALIEADKNFELLYNEFYDALTAFIEPQLRRATSEPIPVSLEFQHREEFISTWLRRHGWFVVESGYSYNIHAYRSKKHYIDHALKGFWTVGKIIWLFIFGIGLVAYFDRWNQARHKKSLGRPKLEVS